MILNFLKDNMDIDDQEKLIQELKNYKWSIYSR